MDEGGIARIVSGLYEARLLRDVFGKMAPGLLGASVFVALCPAIDLGAYVRSQLSHTWVDGLVVAGLLWILGFVFQATGEHFGVSAGGRGRRRRWGLGSYPVTRHARSQEHFHERRVAFATDPMRPFRQQRERLVVVKEATGNAAYAIFVSVALALVGRFVLTACDAWSSPSWRPADIGDAALGFVPGALLFLLGVFLLRKHVSTRREQAEHEVAALALARRANPEVIDPDVLAEMRASAGLELAPSDEADRA